MKFMQGPHVATKRCAPRLPESRGEKCLFHGQPNLSPIFREISCAHFSWKLQDENRRNILPFSAAFLAHVGETFRQNFALGAFRHNTPILKTPMVIDLEL